MNRIAIGLAALLFSTSVHAQGAAGNAAGAGPGRAKTGSTDAAGGKSGSDRAAGADRDTERNAMRNGDLLCVQDRRGGQDKGGMNPGNRTGGRDGSGGGRN